MRWIGPLSTALTGLLCAAAMVVDLLARFPGPAALRKTHSFQTASRIPDVLRHAEEARQ